jgi:hypothetical protein
MVETRMAQLVASEPRLHRDWCGMKGAIVSIQLPGDARKNSERYLRVVTEDSRVETIREAVTAMMKTPADFEIGSKKAKPSYQRARALKKAEEAQNDDHIIPGVDSKVDEALVGV